VPLGKYTPLAPVIPEKRRHWRTKKIGHMGFFRAEHRDTLWGGAAEWLQAEQ
jgi:hypothetical protein